MKWSLVLLAPVLAVALLGIESQAQERGWLSSPDAGFRQARDSGKPLLFMFRCVP